MVGTQYIFVEWVDEWKKSIEIHLGEICGWVEGEEEQAALSNHIDILVFG